MIQSDPANPRMAHEELLPFSSVLTAGYHLVLFSWSSGGILKPHSKNGTKGSLTPIFEDFGIVFNTPNPMVSLADGIIPNLPVVITANTRLHQSNSDLEVQLKLIVVMILLMKWSLR